MRPLKVYRQIQMVKIYKRFIKSGNLKRHKVRNLKIVMVFINRGKMRRVWVSAWT